MAAAVVLATLVLGAAPLRAQEAPLVRVVGPGSVEESSEPAKFDVVVENTPEFGAFQFVLVFDSDYFEYVDAQRGELLGSTGRDVQCLDPQKDTGAVLIVCTTLGATPAGAKGSGTLYSVLLRPKSKGNTELGLTRVQLSTIQGEEIPSRTQGATVRLTGESSGLNWLIWGPVIGGSALAIIVLGGLAAMMRRSGRRESAYSD